MQASHGPTQTLNADFFEISKPTNPVLKTINPVAKPLFSSSLATGPFGAGRANNRVVIDLTRQHNNLPRDTHSRGNHGLPNVVDYVDPAKASENIKALLEGAFDDDDEKAEARLPRRKIPPQNQTTSAKFTKESSLTDALSKLSVTPTSGDAVKAEESTASDTAADEADDAQDGSVDGLKVKLLPHQLEGVAWMLDKENGARKKKALPSKGGILADDMGLGKTIQAMTLMLVNPKPLLSEQDSKDEKAHAETMSQISKGTLIVAPLALIKQWESEIKTKVDTSHELRVLVHHGPTRTKSYLELKKYDVVITTYQILASEHAGSSTKPGGLKIGCYGIHWWRVILDEAHSIKNRAAKSTLACCALDSWHRWCLTGTPMQNNLDELQSLIHFLRIKPYDDLKHWRDQITSPMKNGRGNQAMKRVQYFLKAVMKRRTKDILKKDGALNFGKQTQTNGAPPAQKMNIVARDVETIVCELSVSERDFYDKLSERAKDRLHDMMAGNKHDYIGALVLLLRLRQVCNHPSLIRSAMSQDKDALATAGLGYQSPRKQDKDTGDVDDLADMLDGLDVATGDSGAIASKKTIKPHRSHPRRAILDSDDEEEDGKGEWLVGEADRPDKPDSDNDEDAEGTGISLGPDNSDTESDDSVTSSAHHRPNRKSSATDVDSGSDVDDTIASSTKIQHIIKILRKESPSQKVIVFSQFTSMLDLIEPHLARHALKYVRYDGSMRNDAREASLASLRDDKRTRVLLCSLKCGALGLNLTAASRVIIVEPFWNPFVEEQAIDRVHRLNQTVDVKVYKLTVANTVEERILELQAKKRELANAAIEGGKTMAKLSMKDLLSLFGNTDASDHGGNQWRGSSDVVKAGERTGVHGASNVLPDRRKFSGNSANAKRPDDGVYGRR